MTSLSLSRVLPTRRTSLEIQRDNFEKLQNLSINKAVNSLEIPVKEKHVRSTIIGTFHDKGAQTFWTVAQRLPLEENRIVAWKFCHVLHKVLREGHFNCLQQSLRHREMLKNLGKLWVHLQDGYAKLIQLYTNLLITKLSFHERNPRFPGNLQLSGEELDDIGGNDMNNYFQLSVEMFDYMDDILTLLGGVFELRENYHSSSMTNSGQCQLAPLIPCIQDSNQLYDFSVKILFKLHTMLPSDTLAGHRDRFLKQFTLLKKYYKTTDSLQYFKTLINIPLLPEKPPNFLIQSELATYHTPVVSLPQEDQFDREQEMITNLIDTSDTSSRIISPDSIDLVDYNGTQGSSATAELLIQRDNLIDNLQTELSRLKNEKEGVVSEFRATIASMNDQITLLEEKYTAAKLDLDKEHEKCELLSIQKKPDELIDQKLAAAEDKTKLIEEKYQKLKAVYLQMREEHITLLRQGAETEKQVVMLKKVNSEYEVQKEILQSKVDKLTHELSTIKDTYVQSSNQAKSDADSVKNEILIQSKKHKEEIDKLNSEISVLRNEANIVKQEYNSFKEKHIAEKEDLLQQKTVVEKALSDLESTHKELENNFAQEKENSIILLRSLMRCGVTSAADIIRATIDEFDNPAISSLQCGPDYLRSLVPSSEESLNYLSKSLKNLEENKIPSEDVATHIVRTAHSLSAIIIQGIATSNTSKDIVFGESMAQECRNLANAVAACIHHIELIDNTSPMANQITNGSFKTSGEHIIEIRKLLESVVKLSGNVGGQNAIDSIDSVETELTNMDKAIEEAVLRMEEMLCTSRAADSGIKLEVNEKILDACKCLVTAIRELVKKSRLLQAEIVAQGKGTNTAKEFYKRNHQWTEGLISAAKAVALGANLLLASANKVVTEGGKFEHVMVASQEIAASTIQLVVASRVRAARGSSKLEALSVASKAVSSATGTVIATAKSCAQLVDESEELDMSGISLQAGRRLEMESRVKLLELEQALATERLKLAALRRTNYRLAESEIAEKL